MQKTDKMVSESKTGAYTYQLKTSGGWRETIYDAVFFQLDILHMLIIII
jgi:hypothetical protein